MPNLKNIHFVNTFFVKDWYLTTPQFCVTMEEANRELILTKLDDRNLRFPTLTEVKLMLFYKIQREPFITSLTCFGEYGINIALTMQNKDRNCIHILAYEAEEFAGDLKPVIFVKN